MLFTKVFIILYKYYNNVKWIFSFCSNFLKIFETYITYIVSFHAVANVSSKNPWTSMLFDIILKNLQLLE